MTDDPQTPERTDEGLDERLMHVHDLLRDYGKHTEAEDVERAARRLRGERGREGDEVDVDGLIAEMERIDLPVSPLPSPQTPMKLGAWLIQNENLTPFGDEIVARAVAAALRGAQREPGEDERWDCPVCGSSFPQEVVDRAAADAGVPCPACKHGSGGDPPMCECSMFLAYHLYCAYEWQPVERTAHRDTEGDDG